MQICVIFNTETLQIKRLAGPMPIDVNAHIQPGEGYLIADTTEPKSVAELQALVGATQ